MSKPENNPVLNAQARITLLKEWGSGVLSQKDEAREQEVREVLTLGVSLWEEVSQLPPLLPPYFQALEELRPYAGTFLKLNPEDLSGNPERSAVNLPWEVLTSEIYEKGLVPWAQTLGLTPLQVWYMFEQPGNPPEELLREDLSWNSNATAEQILKAAKS